MTRPGFRKGRPGGTPAPARADAAEGFLGHALFSQAQILHLMKNEFARARRHGIEVGCLLLQVDRLQQLVDLHGVDLRTAVRGEVARLVREKTRGSDLLGTTNDDRYLLVLPHTGLANTLLVANRLHAQFGERQVTIDGRVLGLTMSIGVTACDDQKTLFFDSLLAQAEAAADFATRSGGNQVVAFAELPLRADEPGGGGGP